jgi:voltage-gated potassium channel Kch
MRERWFGATGRRVPELARDGDIDVTGAVVLDEVDVEELRRAFDAGTPVVVRAASPERVKEALARPEVSCVLVPPDRSDLLELDLTELTYG